MTTKMPGYTINELQNVIRKAKQKIKAETKDKVVSFPYGAEIFPEVIEIRYKVFDKEGDGSTFKIEERSFDWHDLYVGFDNDPTELKRNDIPPGINIDASPENQDWIKQGWDLPPYKSEEFLRSFPDLEKFRKLPVYKFAVENGLIKNDEWQGK